MGIVRGIGEGLCQFGSSAYLVEDVQKTIGEGMMEWRHQTWSTSLVQTLKLSGFPNGTAVSYIDTDDTTISTIVESDSFEAILTADDDENRIIEAFHTLTLTAPPHSDVDFDIRMVVVTTGGYEHLYVKKVVVFAVADPPSVTATDTISVSPLLE